MQNIKRRRINKTNYQPKTIKHLRLWNFNQLKQTYVISKKLGQGSFGRVFAATEKCSNNPYALKIITKSYVGDCLKHIENEIKILQLVNHPNIIKLYKIYECPNNLYLFFELCNEELSNILVKRERLREDETLIIIQNLASAVSYLHKHGIVHRDLKLENILLANKAENAQNDWNIKVTDFGLSICKNKPGRINMLEDCCGTLTYMAPEMLTHKPYTNQCDVWSMGIIMYRLLSGQFPFSAKDNKKLAEMIIEKEPILSSIDIKPEAKHMLSKMLVKNPAFRITATEILNHPWILGVEMSNHSSGNVLDIMSLWKSEMLMTQESNTNNETFKNIGTESNDSFEVLTEFLNKTKSKNSKNKFTEHKKQFKENVTSVSKNTTLRNITTNPPQRKTPVIADDITSGSDSLILNDDILQQHVQKEKFILINDGLNPSEELLQFHKNEIEKSYNLEISRNMHKSIPLLESLKVKIQNSKSCEKNKYVLPQTQGVSKYKNLNKK